MGYTWFSPPDMGGQRRLPPGMEDEKPDFLTPAHSLTPEQLCIRSLIGSRTTASFSPWFIDSWVQLFLHPVTVGHLIPHCIEIQRYFPCSYIGSRIRFLWKLQKLIFCFLVIAFKSLNNKIKDFIFLWVKFVFTQSWFSFLSFKTPQHIEVH